MRSICFKSVNVFNLLIYWILTGFFSVIYIWWTGPNGIHRFLIVFFILLIMWWTIFIYGNNCFWTTINSHNTLKPKMTSSRLKKYLIDFSTNFESEIWFLIWTLQEKEESVKKMKNMWPSQWLNKNRDSSIVYKWEEWDIRRWVKCVYWLGVLSAL